IEAHPARLARRPVLERLPFAGWRHEAAHRWLVHHAGVVVLEPVVEPAQRLLVVLVDRAVEVDRRADHHLLRTLPLLPGGERAGEMQAVDAPAAAEVGRDRGAIVPCAPLAPEGSVE